jgi:hypothetical protein
LSSWAKSEALVVPSKFPDPKDPQAIDAIDAIGVGREVGEWDDGRPMWKEEK